MRKKVTISLPEKTWGSFQKLCKKKDLVPSYEIQKYMQRCLDEKDKT